MPAKHLTHRELWLMREAWYSAIDHHYVLDEPDIEEWLDATEDDKRRADILAEDAPD